MDIWAASSEVCTLQRGLHSRLAFVHTYDRRRPRRCGRVHAFVHTRESLHRLGAVTQTNAERKRKRGRGVPTSLSPHLRNAAPGERSALGFARKLAARLATPQCERTQAVNADLAAKCRPRCSPNICAHGKWTQSVHKMSTFFGYIGYQSFVN